MRGRSQRARPPGTPVGDDAAYADAVTEARMLRTLVAMLLTARVVHLSQATIDVTVGYRAFAHPAAAVGLAAACAAESAVLAAAVLRAGRLTLPPLLLDAAFGIAGLYVIGFAMSGEPARLTPLNWMLPYTVGTAAVLGLSHTGSHPRRRFRVAGLSVAVLMTAYLTSMLGFRRGVDERAADLVTNTLNYPLFLAGGIAIAVVVRRRMLLLRALRRVAVQQAARTSREATRAALGEAVFAPIRDIMSTVIADPHAAAGQFERARAVRARIDDLAIELAAGQGGAP